MRDPFRIDEPAIISFSGGRTSGYMLWRILQANDGVIPSWAHVVFCNTGKEYPETLDFVQEVGERWNVKINWLEYRYDLPLTGENDGRHCYEVVSHNSASRNGEPFDMVIRARKMLPNPVTSFCSAELKVKTTERWTKAELGWTHWLSYVGLRADEPRRVAKTRARNESGKDTWETAMPLALAMVTRRQVKAFWDAQPFDLRLLNVDGKTPDGNCDNCFKKGLPNIAGRARRQPETLHWWRDWEMKAPGLGMQKPEAALFRMDRPSYAAILKMAQDQGDLIGDPTSDDNIDCACTD